MRSDIPHLSWPDFLNQFVWHQGEHVTYVGPTGSGKTTLASQLLHRRDFVVALATKPRDATMQALIRREHYQRIREFQPPHMQGRRSYRLVLWPRFERPEDIINQQLQMDRALREIFASGGWTVFADELFYLCRFLKLAPLFEIFWSQARSLGITVVGGTQRPAFIPLMAYDQATHLFFWRDNDDTNLRRIGGLGGIDAALIRRTVAQLPKHTALYVNTRDGQLMTTKAERR